MAPYDYLIIGQGLAGSLLSWDLIKHGKRVLVIDNTHQDASSMVAAGLINPVTGKRLRLEENCEALLATGEHLYSEIAATAGKRFHTALPILRILRDAQQADYLDKRLLDPEYQPYLQRASSCPLPAPHGTALQHKTGFIDTRSLLTWLARWLSEQDALQQQRIDHDAIQLNEQRVSIGNQLASNVIFCEGFRGQDNPWFKLPFQPARGEILSVTIEQPALGRDHILHRGDWLIPVGANQWRFGATHDWDMEQLSPTAAGREALQSSLSSMVPGCRYTIQDHVAGIRPATRDRAPFIGSSTTDSRLWMFNGFGSKGCLLIPYYARLFANHLLEQQPLPPEVDITRHAP